MTNRRMVAQRFANNINSDLIKQIILYGSVARGDDTEDSDIDILIISSYEPEIRPKISEEIFNAIKDYRELISANVISEELFNKTKDYSFLTNVLKDGIILG